MKTVNWSEEGLIPGLLYFQNGGTYTGSVNDFDNRAVKEFRYKIGPGEEGILTEVWYGPFGYEKSEIVDRHGFSLDEEGRKEMLLWLNEKYESMIE